MVQPSGAMLVCLSLAFVALLLRAVAFARLLLAVVLVAAATVVVVPLHAWWAAPLEARHPLPDALPRDVDGILILGGAVDARASVEVGQLQTNGAGERVFAGAALAARYPLAQLVFTGTTAEALANDLRVFPNARSMLFGPQFVTRNVTFLPASASTFDDALRALDALGPVRGERWILVTSAWHMPRAWATFRTLGWTTFPYPVDTSSAGATIDWPLPEAFGTRLADVDRTVREWGAVAVYLRTGRIAREAWADPGAWRTVEAFANALP
jgi:uncharacterized SAM-binding protein YcdF (DUF218 family)